MDLFTASSLPVVASDIWRMLGVTQDPTIHLSTIPTYTADFALSSPTFFINLQPIWPQFSTRRLSSCFYWQKNGEILWASAVGSDRHFCTVVSLSQISVCSLQLVPLLTHSPGTAGHYSSYFIDNSIQASAFD